MVNLPLGKLGLAIVKVNASQVMLNIYLSPVHGAPKTIRIDAGDQWLSEVSEAANNIIAASESIEMPVSLFHADLLKKMLPGVKRIDANLCEIDPVLGGDLLKVMTSLGAALVVETDTKVAVVLTPKELSYYEPKEPAFGIEVADKFKSAAYDIHEAGKCLALGRSTASVFHCMRVVETALRAIYKCLGLPELDNPSWGITLSEIRKERVRRGDRKWSENDYFQDVYSSIDAIKDAQRDPTMHVQTIYTEEEAERIFKNTGALMKKIASKMDDQGQPLA